MKQGGRFFPCVPFHMIVKMALRDESAVASTLLAYIGTEAGV